MLSFVTLLGALALAAAAPQHNVFKIDLDPEEAARYIQSPPFSEPQLAARTAVLPLIKYNDPRFRAAEAGPSLGHYWKNGHEIENTDDYVEEVYPASQFHGQDGLGAYAYGYKTPESSKVENKVRSGDVTGSYTYKAGNSNELIKVRYWADSQGFHQEDNIPKYVPKQVEEAPEVRAARIAHEKAWNEAAYANLHPGAAAAAAASNTQNNYYNNYNDYQTGASEQQGSYALPPSQLRQGRAYGQDYGQDYSQNQYVQGQYSENQYQQGPGQQYPSTTTTTTPEPTGPPRGFFYSFDYPVNIIVPKSSLQGDVKPGYPVDHDTVAVGQKK